MERAIPTIIGLSASQRTLLGASHLRGKPGTVPMGQETTIPIQAEESEQAFNHDQQSYPVA